MYMKNNCGGIFLLIIIVLGAVLLIKNVKESFLSPGIYPESTTTPLLAPPFGDYKLLDNPSLSNTTL